VVETHSTPQIDRRVAQFIVVIIFIDQPRLCSYTNLPLESVEQTENVEINACECTCVFECRYLHIYSVVHCETLTHTWLGQTDFYIIKHPGLLFIQKYLHNILGRQYIIMR